MRPFSCSRRPLSFSSNSATRLRSGQQNGTSPELLRFIEHTEEALEMQRGLFEEYQAERQKNGYVYEEIAECFTGPGPRTGSSRMVRRLHAAFQRPTNQPRTNPAQQAQRAGTNWQAKTSIGQACFTRVNCDPLATIFLVMEKFIRQKFRRQRTKFD